MNGSQITFPARLRAMRAHLEDQPMTHADSQDLKTLSEAAAYIETVEAERDELAKYAHDTTVALTGLTYGGSEFFGKRIGHLYTADIPYCLNYITRSRVNKVDLVKAERRAEAAEARVAELEAEITQTLNSTTFLVERLEDWQGNNLTDETARDWGGHVVPALARLRDYLAERDNEEAELLTIAAMHGQKQGDDRVRELEARVAELTEALRTAKEGLEDAQKYMTRGGIAPVFTERLRAVNAALAGKEEG